MEKAESPYLWTTGLTFYGLIGMTVINALVIISNKYSGSKRLFDALTLLTAVDVIAAYTYAGMFVSKELLGTAKSFRYLEWFLTIPLMIIAAVFYMDYLNTSHGATNLNWWGILLLVVLSIAMVVCAFLASSRAECQRINWLLLAGVFYILTMLFLAALYLTANSAWFFAAVVIVLALYGFSYFLPEEYQDPAFNVLDGVSKIAFSLLISLTLLSKV